MTGDNGMRAPRGVRTHVTGRLIYVHTIHDTGMEEKKDNGKVIIKNKTKKQTNKQTNKQKVANQYLTIHMYNNAV